MKFRILTGTPIEVESKLNELEGKIKIESVETKFDKYGVKQIAIVVSITNVATFPTFKEGD